MICYNSVTFLHTVIDRAQEGEKTNSLVCTIKKLSEVNIGYANSWMEIKCYN